MITYYNSLLLSSNAVTLRRDKSILYSRVVILFLILFIILFFYLSFTYIYKKNSFLVGIAFGISLLDLIAYISNSYYIKKLKDLVILIRYFIVFVTSPIYSLLSLTCTEIKYVIYDLIKNTSYYKNFKNIYYKKGYVYLLVMLATSIYDFSINHFILNMHNIIIFNCICAYLAFLCEDVLNISLIV
jgi:hypothetical protein